MKIHKLLIGCSILITISLITGCSSKSNNDIDDTLKTTIVSDEELNKNAREVTEPLPDISTANINDPLNGTDSQLDFDMMGEVTAIDGYTLTISMSEESNPNPPESKAEDTDPNGTDITKLEQTLTVTNETFINIQKNSETTAASFSDIKVGDMIKFSYTVSETGDEILYTITIMNS